MKYPVYGDSDNWFFSDYVNRDFGINCHVILNNNSSVFNFVQPTNEYIKENLPIIGYIEILESKE